MARLILFASVRERAGFSQMDLPLDGAATVREVLRMAAEKASIDPSTLLGGSLLYAVNQESAGPEGKVEDSDEVAVLPPLSGGL